MDSLTTIDESQEQEAMYLYKWLLERFDFRWRSRDDERYLDRDLERNRQIEKLRELIDPSSVIYNQYAPKDKQ